MDVSVGDVVLPGDKVCEISEDQKKRVILGPGLRLNVDQVLISKCGILRMKNANVYWVDSHQKRYIPSRGETVVGVVTNKSGEVFRVDIGSSDQASLSYLAFEGATKKLRPDVNVGDIVFARLITASKDMEPELVCVDSYGKAGKLGILSPEGFIFSCSLNLVRKILRQNCPLLKILGHEIPHEIAIGMNGKVWVKARNVRATLAVGHAILAAEHLTKEEIIYMCDGIVNVLTGMQ
uniref:Exosome complex component RRP40 n=2 Tax=Timema TaxID=61471 RepID=A0A7R8VZ04_TIMDO|nr:unnamed protein product [Timema douglasi]